jgi:hypothetical protein
MEQLPESPVGGLVEGVISVARPVIALGSAVAASGASGATELTVAGSVVAGFGIVEWFRKLGTAKVNENLDSLGQATEDALNRVERILLEHGTSIDEIRGRLNSQDFKDGMASAALQALRTTQMDRLSRMALILANGVKDGDLKSESLDDMMRAATELTGRDISILVKVAEIQAKTATFYSLTTGDGTINRPREVWKALEEERFISPRNQMEIRVSLARLQSVGFGAEIQTTDSTWHPRFLVTPLGERFIERLQEVEG